MNPWEQDPVSSKLKFDDPAWDAAEARAAAKHGVPQSVLKTIRTVGERSNFDQVSDKGAQGVYQFVKGTRDAFKKKYNIDAYGDTTDEQTEAAALHLKESYERTKDWKKAMAGFNGGISGEKGTNTTPENVAYAQRTGAALDASPWEQDEKAPSPAQPTPVQVNPGHKAALRKMGTEEAPPEPSVLQKTQRVGQQVDAGAGRYITGRVLPAVEDLVRFRTGPGKTPQEQLTGEPRQYLTQPITDWGEKRYQANKGTAAELGEAGASALGAMAVPSPSGKAGILANLLRNVLTSAGVEYGLAPQPGETREGNAAKAATITGLLHGASSAASKGYNFVKNYANKEVNAANRIVSSAGGREAAGEAAEKIAPNASGVVTSPASRSGVPGWHELERGARDTSPGAFATLDQLTAQSAQKAVGESKNVLWGTLSKVRTNDVHRREAQQIIDKMDFSRSPEMKQELQNVLAQYGKGSGTNLQAMVEHLLQASQKPLKTASGEVKLTPAEITKFSKQLEDFTMRHAKDAPLAAQKGVEQAVNKDLSAAAAAKGAPASDATMDLINTFDKYAENPIVGGLASATGHGKTLHMARIASRTLRAIKGTGDNEVLNKALSRSDAQGIEELLRKYDKTMNDRARAEMTRMILSRGAGSAASSATGE